MNRTWEEMQSDRLDEMERHYRWPFQPPYGRWSFRFDRRYLRVPRHRMFGGVKPAKVRGPDGIMSWPGARKDRHIPRQALP